MATKADEKKARELLDKGADYEFFRNDTATYVMSAYNEAKDLNLNEDDIKSLIQNIWSAATSEYGE